MQSKQVFLIEDDADDQELFLTALEKVDPSFECRTAANGQDALAQLTSSHVAPDVIFLDLNMPLMNGQQFLKKIKQEDDFKNIPVIIFTTSSNPNTTIEVRQLGAKDLITKPNSFTELTALLKRELNCFAT